MLVRYGLEVQRRQVLTRKAFWFYVALILGATNAHAYRIEFITVVDGQRLANSEACFYQGRNEGPAALYLASNDVRCFSADQIIDMPSGVWSYYARNAGGFVSSHGSALVHGGDPNPDQGYQSIRLDLRRAAYVDFGRVSDSDRFAAYVPMADSSTYAAATLPLPADRRRIEVPADEPFIILRVRNGRPIGAGPMTRLKAGQTIDASKIIPPVAQRDVIAWIRVEDSSRDEILHVGAPIVSLIDSKGREHHPEFHMVTAGGAHRSFVIFPNPPDEVRSVRLTGDEWKTTDVPLHREENSGTFIDAPLVARLAQRVTVRWTLPPMLVNGPRTSCREGEPGEPVGNWSVELLHCDGDARNCRSERSLPIKPEPSGVASFDVRTPGPYVAVLNGNQKRLGMAPVVAQARKDVEVNLDSNVPTVFGTLSEAGRPIKAIVKFETGSAVSDVSGRYEAVLEADPLDNVIEVVPCDGSETFQHIPKEPIRGNRQYDIHIPANRIEISVVDASSGAVVPRASIGRGLFTTAEAARAAQPHDDLTADDRGKALLRRFEPGNFLRICAGADSYSSACADPVAIESDTTKAIEFSLKRSQLRRGRLSIPTPVIAGTLYRTTRLGTIVEEIAVKEDGTFSYRGDSPADALVLVSLNHALAVVPHPPVPESEDLQVAVPEAGARNFSVELDRSLPIRGTWFTVAVGDVVVPLNALANHLSRRGISNWIEEGSPVRVVDIVESAPLRVLAIVAAYPEPADIPDLFTQPQYAAIRELRDVPANGLVVIGHRR